MHTAESDLSSFVVEYLGKIETKFDNTLACLSGSQIGSNREKNGGRKSRDTLYIIRMKKGIYNIHLGSGNKGTNSQLKLTFFFREAKKYCIQYFASPCTAMFA